MTTQKLSGSFVPSRVKQPDGGQVPRTLDQIRLMTDTSGGMNFHAIQSVSPWGFIVPGEAATTLSFVAAMDGHRIPHGSLFVVRWQAEGDTIIKEAEKLHLGPDPVVTLPLPNAWFADAIGKRVSLTYEVKLWNGSTVQGPGIDFLITHKIDTTWIALEGLQVNQPINPENFPDGIAATVQRVVNAQPFHDTTLVIRTLGQMHPEDDYVECFTVHLPLPGIADGPMNFTLEKYLYTDPFDWGYALLRLDFSVVSQLAPWPNQGWDYAIGVGGNPVIPGWG